MTGKRFRSLALAVLLGCVVMPLALLGMRSHPVDSGLIVHEWGTFTSIAGADGLAMEWRPLSGSTDLPSFVEHFRNAGFKLGLRGTVRMETPVLYFYSQREQTVSVRASFAKGVITEWYPQASRVEPTAALYDASLYPSSVDGSITWDAVTLSPNQSVNLPEDHRENHYYTARQTTSTPVRVRTAGSEQYEKFLFYRGVSAFDVPISAQLVGGSKLRVENRIGAPLSNAILFERRGDKIGFRINGALQTDASLDLPELNGSVDSLARELEGLLIAQGLYQNEAQAMVQTWRDSWFEEGSRLLYIVPRALVDTVLPLSIKPVPAQTTRVFVGRVELITAATASDVERAFAAGDKRTLFKFARFLEPILKTMIENASSIDRVKQLRRDLNQSYDSQFH